MLDDFTMIVQKLPAEYDYINIYPIGDVHIGSKEFDEKSFKTLLDVVAKDDRGYIITVGDLINNGVKSSKTNVYEETMPPSKQKEYIYNALLPLKSKILGGVGGNHEYRNVREVDNDILYDVYCRLGIESLYRQNMAFIKVNVGLKTNKKQCSYMIGVHHGKSENKQNKFAYGVDGLDVLITGHIHKMRETEPCKIRIDAHNEKVTVVPFTHIVVKSFQKYGGYGLRDMYLPQQGNNFQRVTLFGREKRIDYHSEGRYEH